MKSSILKNFISSQRYLSRSHPYYPISAKTGQRYSQDLEEELIQFSQNMNFTSHLWITERERKGAGMKLRSSFEIPFCPRCILEKENNEKQKIASAIINSAFIEETDLFFFFMLRPLPVRNISYGVHWVHLDGQWREFSINNLLFTKLENLRLLSSNHIRLNLNSTTKRKWKSHMHELISPFSTTSNGRRSIEFFWIDKLAVNSHKLSTFTDTIWLPLIFNNVHPICMYNMDQIILI